MFYPSKEEFIKLSKKGNLIPVYKEISGDMETPVSAFLKLSQGHDYACLLESVEGQEKIARFSFIGHKPSAIIEIKSGEFRISTLEGKNRFKTTRIIRGQDPLSELKRFMSRYKFVHTDRPGGHGAASDSRGQGSLRFCGGLVGYLGYDAARFFEKIPDKNPDELNFPEAMFMLNDLAVIFDHLSHKVKIVSCAFLERHDPLSIDKAYKKAVKNIEEVIQRLAKHLKPDKEIDDLHSSKKDKIKITSNVEKKDFIKMVLKAKEYIRKGDIIQAVLSQRLSAKIKSKPFNIYRRLRGLNPSAYMFYLKFGQRYLIGSSPEMLTRAENKTAATRPIAGTRPRGINDAQDNQMEKELLNDQKEKAEHLMLVDLGRNDLGRVCKFGSVKVTEFMRVERYSHVMHIVSEVQGRLKANADSYDLLKAAFPAGTVSGSPKIRAMEIIDELEVSRRGPYAGAVGYIDFSGNLDTCITIRTILVNRDTAYIQAGAGIVADSAPEKEYQETLNKARAQIEALI